MFDAAHIAAEARFNASPQPVTPPPPCASHTLAPKHASPSAAMTMPAFRGASMRSPSSKTPNAAVKKTWVCISTDASAAVMPTCNAMKRNPNWPTPWARPNATGHRSRTAGGRISSAAGRNANTKRPAPS